MSAQKITLTSDQLDRLIGKRVLHIERQPTAQERHGARPGEFQWVLTVRPLPKDGS